ncbi:hypothetical protein LINPERPRIM_LOCUS43126 [Linum perenne]
MASDETSAALSSSVHHDDFDPDIDFHDFHPHSSSHNLSRLSVCTSSMYTTTTDDGDADDEDSISRMFMSGLSIENFDADAENDEPRRPNRNLDLISSDDLDSDPGCKSLPATPPRRRRNCPLTSSAAAMTKEYVSENEGKGAKPKRNSRRRRLIRDQRFRDCDYGWSGDSETGGGGSGGMVVITRPKGGSRSLCMDLGEVKACKDLGFELEHERMVEVSGRVSVSGNSSGGDSPIANWRISSPGDDPRDVKARLKVWAQAVALVSAANHSANFH